MIVNKDIILEEAELYCSALDFTNDVGLNEKGRLTVRKWSKQDFIAGAIWMQEVMKNSYPNWIKLGRSKKSKPTQNQHVIFWHKDLWGIKEGMYHDGEFICNNFETKCSHWIPNPLNPNELKNKTEIKPKKVKTVNKTETIIKGKTVKNETVINELIKKINLTNKDKLFIINQLTEEFGSLTIVEESNVWKLMNKGYDINDIKPKLKVWRK